MDGAAWCIRVSKPWVGSGNALTALALLLLSFCPQPAQRSSFQPHLTGG